MSKDESPNGLGPVNAVSVRKMSRWPMLMVMLAGLLLVGVLVYSVNFAHNQDDEDESKQVQINESEKPLIMGDGQGLALKPPPVAVVAPPRDPRPEKEDPVVILTHEKNLNPYGQELENLRIRKQQAFLDALHAPIGVAVKQSVVAARASDAGLPTLDQALGQAMSGDDFKIPVASEYNVEADKDREEFFSRRKSRDSDWIAEGRRIRGQPLELKTGFVIPGVMVSGINSELPGALIGQVAQNIFDTATGRNLLIPQGSKLYGVYDSRVIYGQERILIAWNRIIFPDGSAFTLGAMPGGDMGGFAGFNDMVNNHYLRIFGSAVLMSGILGGTAYAMDSNNTGSGDKDKPSMTDEMMAALASQIGQTTTTLLQKNLNIAPTLEIRPGYQFNIVVTKDLVFEKPYRPMR